MKYAERMALHPSVRARLGRRFYRWLAEQTYCQVAHLSKPNPPAANRARKQPPQPWVGWHERRNRSTGSP